MRNLFTYLVPSVLAILLHATVLGLVIANWTEAASPQLFRDEPYYIKTNLVSENPLREKKIQKVRQIEPKKSQNELTSLEITSQANAPEISVTDKNTNQIDGRGDFLTPERETLGEEVSATVIEPLIKLEEPFMVLGSREANARKAVTDNEKTQVYIGQIQRDIVENWSRPPSARNGMQVQLRVFLVPTGEVVEVILEKRSGNDAFDRSAVLAVTKAERFLVPPDSREFEKNFREFTILFRPEDLRL